MKQFLEPSDEKIQRLADFFMKRVARMKGRKHNVKRKNVKKQQQ